MSNAERYTTDITIDNGNVDFAFTGTRGGVTTEIKTFGPLVEADENTQEIVARSRAHFAAAQVTVVEAVADVQEVAGE